MNIEGATARQSEAVNTKSKRTLAIAGPGSGKTRTLIWRMQRLLSEGVNPRTIVAITFTNAAADEIQKRLGDQRLGYCGTLHGYVLRLLNSSGNFVGFTGKLTVMDDNAGEEYLKDRMAFSQVKATQKAIAEEIAKGPPVKPQTPISIFVFDYYQQLKRINMVTYDALLWFGLAMAKASLPIGADYLFVDEYQDSGDLDVAIYNALPIANKFYVGDPDQCQPAGTLVRNADGENETPIANLKVGDKVLTYDRHGKVLLKNGVVRAISSRQYSGLLYEVIAAGIGSTWCTENHKWLIKWPSGKERDAYGHLHCVYMMRKGMYFRIGKTRFFRSGGTTCNNQIIGIALRLQQERADCGWILTVHNSDQEALAQEEILSARYGLPQACFVASKASRHYTQETIDRIYSSLPSLLPNAVRCLNDFGRSLDHPIIDRRSKRTRRTVQEMQACNLISGVMQIPIARKPYNYRKRGSEWATIHFQASMVNNMKVYSLDVTPHHKYVADGLVTCNSIYSFRGANVRHINRMSEDTETRVIPLEHNFRCAPEICDAAQSLIERNKDRYAKATISATEYHGEVILQQWNDQHAEATGLLLALQTAYSMGESLNDMAILFRTNVLVDHYSKIIGAQFEVRKKKYQQMPPDWPKCLLLLSLLVDPRNDYLATKWVQAKDGAEMARKASMRSLKEKMSINSIFLFLPTETPAENIGRALGKEGISVESILQVEAIQKALPGATLSDLLFHIRTGELHKEEIGDGVTITTLHSSKGREWETVFLPALESHVLPGEGKNVNLEEERRLLFVGMTRAKRKLVLSWAGMRTRQWGPRGLVASAPSPFLAEIKM